MLAGLQDLGITHGDVRPELIFVAQINSPVDVEFKLLDKTSELGTAIETQLHNVVSANSLYLCPTYYEALTNGKMKSLGPMAYK